MPQLTKEQKRERRKKRKKALKIWLKKYGEDLRVWGCIAYVFLNILIMDIIIAINDPEYFEWYLDVML